MSTVSAIPEVQALQGPSAPERRFTWFAWATLAYCVLVVLWGAYVRATGSGAGCGEHWPLCNGVVLPRAAKIETLIELSHRATSGILMLLVLGLVFAAFRTYPKRSSIRQAALWSLTFCLTEIVIGAGLVLFKLVAHDASLTRVVSLAAHLINTLILVAALTLTAWRASGHIHRPHRPGLRRGLIGFSLAATMIVGTTGAITALGDTLYPATSLAAGVSQDFSATAHFLVRLRVLHPVFAIGIGLYIIMMTVFTSVEKSSPLARRLGALLIGLVLIQLGAGAMNVYLLAPVWLQLVHLLLADLVWITLVLFYTEAADA